MVNSPAYENYPAVAANGNLYFSSTRDSEGNDLWVAHFEDGRYTIPQAITELNTSWSDADPYIDPGERFMIFSSTRPGGFGSGDLYITYSQVGTWSAPTNLGPIVNSLDYEYTPMVSPDGERLYFSKGLGGYLCGRVGGSRGRDTGRVGHLDVPKHIEELHDRAPAFL